MRIGTVLTACLALGGCAEGDVAGFGPGVRGGGGGLPAVRVAARQNVVTPPGRRDLGLAVRSFTAGPDGGLQEIAGAACRVSGGAFGATVVTPARLVVPDLGPDAPGLRADCRAGGLVGAAEVPPVFAWDRSGGNPAERAAWGLGWTYGFERVGPAGYPNLPVILAPERAS